MSAQPRTAAQAKDAARRLRAGMAEAGTSVSHARALELVARQHGFRDWNTMSAALSHDPPARWAVGDKVSGSYLSRPFTARVVACEDIAPGWVRLDLQLDVAVDVVTSERFSNFRRRIRGTVGPKGATAERTSDGTPHLQIDP
ncbi:glyoxalase superfamily protein [Pseudooceanicola aestuarii]|uniref:glyoxalase superfamily protein n=1 Tax=Pseudooceanicola aestuarii TaxID=2697319 RepID=UPI0013D2DA16|nr:glyoxalase superfamily protein [Pseudooceanicola aestuarii]